MQMTIRFIYDFKGVKTTFTSEPVDRHLVQKTADDLLKTGRVKEIEIVDELGQEWTLKEFKKLNEKLDEEPENITVLFDGGFDVESSSTGVGTAIYYTKGGRRYRLRENARLDGLDSNNEAEYAALYFAMQKLEEIGANSQPVTITGDSLTVLNQLGGDWPCYEETHARFLARIEEKIASMRLKPLYKPVDRRHNKEADQLAKQALEGTSISSHAEIGS
ncbi:reverse transcriptase-like protein [Domibacillus robiginosus]|uniref:reverse transcriptase-like protein n=1 Tax=Domibacillus robiginosus TaxID=1071054 RepID=UPI00067DC880|nr:reverse transcriptase-like protein [Domibacillus robiginosus]